MKGTFFYNLLTNTNLWAIHTTYSHSGGRINKKYMPFSRKNELPQV